MNYVTKEARVRGTDVDPADLIAAVESAGLASPPADTTTAAEPSHPAPSFPTRSDIVHPHPRA